jgi:hypothetical protein
MKKGTTRSGKKKTKSDPRVGDDDILPEYDFSRAGPTGCAFGELSRSEERRVMARFTSHLVMIAALLAAPVTVHAHATGVCGDAEQRHWLRAKIQPLMLSADSATTNLRRQFYLPLVHPDSIVYVDDERICERVARVYYADRLGPLPLRGVSVARIGDRWAVLGENRAGEWTILEIYTRDFELLASLAT